MYKVLEEELSIYFLSITFCSYFLLLFSFLISQPQKFSCRARRPVSLCFSLFSYLQVFMYCEQDFGKLVEERGRNDNTGIRFSILFF